MAALTHDIVWMEAHEVNGEKVLVPVLYLAQADGRLAPNGALIQGKDVTLISGGELVNQGTLRASDNLSATGKNLVNSGLIEAGNRLDLLATDSIRNAQGGIIAGRDVSAIALTGDILNERSITRHRVDTAGRTEQRDYLDSAARIEAANSLSLNAGRDIANIGSALQAGGDLFLNAGRDVLISSQEERIGQAFGAGYREALERDLQKIRAKGGVVPPGYHAQLGLLYSGLGKDDQMVQQLETEKALFPESSTFMDFLLKNVEQGGQP